MKKSISKNETKNEIENKNYSPIPTIEYQLNGEDFIEAAVYDPSDMRSFAEQVLVRLRKLIGQGAIVMAIPSFE